jgi:sugar-phosphatase
VPKVRIVVKGILFDLDGVLVDSTQVVERIWRDFALAHGLNVAETLKNVHGRRTVETIRLLVPDLDEFEVAAELERLEIDGDVRALPGSARLLSALDQNAWGVVTSGSTAVALARLRSAALPVPAVLITADGVTRGKPDPEGYLAGAAAIGVAPDHCLVIEDSPAGIAAGTAAGAHTLALLTTHEAGDLAKAMIVVRDLRDVTILADGRDNGLHMELEISPTQ